MFMLFIHFLQSFNFFAASGVIVEGLKKRKSGEFK